MFEPVDVADGAARYLLNAKLEGSSVQKKKSLDSSALMNISLLSIIVISETLQQSMMRVNTIVE